MAGSDEKTAFIFCSFFGVVSKKLYTIKAGFKSGDVFYKNHDIQTSVYDKYIVNEIGSAGPVNDRRNRESKDLSLFST